MCLCGMYNKPVKTKKYIFYPQRGTAWYTRCPFHDWQYLSMRVAAKTAYTSMRIILVYECNANVVYFDGVQLFNTYGPWGEAWGVSGTLASTLGAMNPLRYRGYVYDAETGFYYLNSRYYNPTWGRFINVDNQITTGSDLTGTNLFAYCGNNPVNRTDSTGEAWWHWALGAAVVAAAAVATVVTCGGFAAAATAVCMVSSALPQQQQHPLLSPEHSLDRQWSMEWP